MGTIANFETIIFNEHLGDDKSDLVTFIGLNFVGDASRLATFEIENPLVNGGYVLLSLWDIQRLYHTIELNGVDIYTMRQSVAFQDGKHKAANWIIPFDANILRQGTNSLQVRRNVNDGDNFHVYTAIVHWKEDVQFSRRPRANLFQRVFGS